MRAFSCFPFFRPQPLRSNERLTEGATKFLLEHTKRGSQSLLLSCMGRERVAVWGGNIWKRRKLNDGKPDREKFVSVFPLGKWKCDDCKWFLAFRALIFFSLLTSSPILRFTFVSIIVESFFSSLFYVNIIVVKIVGNLQNMLILLST